MSDDVLFVHFIGDGYLVVKIYCKFYCLMMCMIYEQ